MKLLAKESSRKSAKSIVYVFPGENSARMLAASHVVGWLKDQRVAHSWAIRPPFPFRAELPGRGGGACVVQTSVQGEILNLTQHQPTPEQIAAGVIEPNQEVKAQIVALLNFDSIPSSIQVLDRARALAAIVKRSRCRAAMIGGLAYLMAPLERELYRAGVTALHAFTERRAIEKHNPDGSVTKTNVFVHIGFFEGMER